MSINIDDTLVLTELDVNGYIVGVTELGAFRRFTVSSVVEGVSAEIGILPGDVTQWNEAYSWGNHAEQNYLTELPDDGSFITVEATNGWGGTTSPSGVLGGIAQAFTCEKNGSSMSQGDTMSFGNGVTNGKGIVMPFSGKLIAATMGGFNIDGTLTLDSYLNGVQNTSYRLTASASGNDVTDIEDWSSDPLSFQAGDTLGWFQQTIPATADGFNVTFFVVFD